MQDLAETPLRTEHRHIKPIVIDRGVMDEERLLSRPEHQRGGTLAQQGRGSTEPFIERPVSDENERITSSQPHYPGPACLVRDGKLNAARTAWPRAGDH